MRDRTIRFRLADEAEDLLTRGQGAPVRSKLHDLVASGARVEVDFEGVRTMTPSFADEALGRLMLELGADRFRESIVLRAADRVIRRLVNTVLAHRLSEISPASRTRRH